MDDILTRQAARWAAEQTATPHCRWCGRPHGDPQCRCEGLRPAEPDEEVRLAEPCTLADAEVTFSEPCACDRPFEPTGARLAEPANEIRMARVTGIALRAEPLEWDGNAWRVAGPAVLIETPGDDPRIGRLAEYDVNWRLVRIEC